MYYLNRMKIGGKIKWLKEIQTQTGTKMASFTVEGFRVTVPVICFKEIAENVLASFSDGDEVGVAGKIQNNDFTKSDGSQVYAMQCVAEKVGAIAQDNGQGQKRAPAQKKVFSNTTSPSEPPLPQEPPHWVPSGPRGPF